MLYTHIMKKTSNKIQEIYEIRKSDHSVVLYILCAITVPVSLVSARILKSYEQFYHAGGLVGAGIATAFFLVLIIILERLDSGKYKDQNDLVFRADKQGLYFIDSQLYKIILNWNDIASVSFDAVELRNRKNLFKRINNTKLIVTSTDGMVFIFNYDKYAWSFNPYHMRKALRNLSGRNDIVLSKIPLFLLW